MKVGAPFSNETSSFEAAQRVAPRVSETEARIMLMFASDRTLVTARQVEVLLDMRQSTTTARIRGLVLKGMLKDSGLKSPDGRIYWTRGNGVPLTEAERQTHGRIAAALLREQERVRRTHHDLLQRLWIGVQHGRMDSSLWEEVKHYLLKEDA